MVVKDFTSKVVFLDSAPLIYFIEGSNTYHNILSQLFTLNDAGQLTFITSSITLIEILVKPVRDGKIDIANQYRDILTSAPGIELIDVTTTISEQAAKLRAQYNFSTPDAIQLATCIEAGADYFLTNDIRLKGFTSAKVITLSEIE